MFAVCKTLIPTAQATARQMRQTVRLSSAIARKSLGTNIHYTETLEDGSIFVSRVPKMLPEVSEADLPPPIRTHVAPANKSLTDEEKRELVKLRNTDPARWTVSKLAKKFGIPSQLVLMTAPCPRWRQQEIQQDADKEWEKLGYKKRLIRLNRLRRRLLW
ncbi:hypothetical protein H4S08_000729 [Coemansia sp. RSA 1365]|nr:hypothetical protein H4S08_000729 [Coemansia sp. RSA 1365]